MQVIDQFPSYFRAEWEILESEALLIKKEDIAIGRVPLASSEVFARLESPDQDQAQADDTVQKKSEEKTNKKGAKSYLKSWLPKTSMLPNMLKRYRTSKKGKDMKLPTVRYVAQTRFVTFSENKVIAIRYINGGEERHYGEFDQVDPSRQKQTQLPPLRWDCEITFARDVSSLTTVDLCNYRQIWNSVKNQD